MFIRQSVRAERQLFHRIFTHLGKVRIHNKVRMSSEPCGTLLPARLGLACFSALVPPSRILPVQSDFNGSIPRTRYELQDF